MAARCTSHICVHERLKTYVCVLYDSPCALLLLPWLGEVDGTSLAMPQGKALPVPAPEPMISVPPVLRRYDAARAAGGRRSLLSAPKKYHHERFLRGFLRRWHSVGKSAHDGTFWGHSACALSNSTML